MKVIYVNECSNYESIDQLIADANHLRNHITSDSYSYRKVTSLTLRILLALLVLANRLLVNHLKTPGVYLFIEPLRDLDYIISPQIN